MSSPLVRIGNFLFHHRNRIFPMFMVVGVLLARPTFAGGSYRMDLWLDLVGLAVCIAGQSLRVATIGFDYIKRGGKNEQIWADKLVEGGMFAHSRNPLYLGNILMFCGMLIILHAPVAYLVGIPAVVFTYTCIVLAEENFLIGKFGDDFRDYCRRVNRWWPNLRGFRHSVRDMEFNWKRVVVKEYSTTFAWMIGAIVLRSWSLYYVRGDEAWPEIRRLSLAFLFIIPAYLLVRHLKVTRRLQGDPRGTRISTAG